MIGHYINNPGVNKPDVKGNAYNYIMAGNGIFLQAMNDYFYSFFPVSQTEVRGLSSMSSLPCVMRQGKIPLYLLRLATDIMFAHAEKEYYAAVTWDNGYHLVVPPQSGSASEVNYRQPDNAVMDLHSHGSGPAAFSLQDNRDEQGFRLYAVIGRLGDIPEMSLRIGVYGYFCRLDFTRVFDGDPYWLNDRCRAANEEGRYAIPSAAD